MSEATKSDGTLTAKPRMKIIMAVVAAFLLYSYFMTALVWKNDSLPLEKPPKRHLQISLDERGSGRSIAIYRIQEGSAATVAKAFGGIGYDAEVRLLAEERIVVVQGEPPFLSVRFQERRVRVEHPFSLVFRRKISRGQVRQLVDLLKEEKS